MKFWSLAALAAVACAGSLNAAIISFDGLTGPNGSGFSSYSEAGLILSAPPIQNITGPFYQFLQSSDGTESIGNSIVSGNNATSYGAWLTIEGPSQFYFNSFDAFSPLEGSYFFITGYQGTSVVYSSSGYIAGSPSSAPFMSVANSATYNNGMPNTLVDRVVLMTQSSNKLFLDNINVTASESNVPEINIWVMFIGGFGLVGASMRHHQRILA